MLQRIVLCLLLLVLGLFLLREGVDRSHPGNLSHQHSGLTVQQVQALATLVTLHVEVAEVQESTLRGYTGGVKTAILVKGDFQLGSDLGQARFEAMDSEHRRATLVLAPPQLNQPRLDHARTRIYSIDRYGLWQVVLADTPDAKLLNQAYAEAQRLVEEAGRDPALIERARRQTERVLDEFCNSLGWRVQIRWLDGAAEDRGVD